MVAKVGADRHVSNRSSPTVVIYDIAGTELARIHPDTAEKLADQLIDAAGAARLAHSTRQPYTIAGSVDIS